MKIQVISDSTLMLFVYEAAAEGEYRSKYNVELPDSLAERALSVQAEYLLVQDLLRSHGIDGKGN